MKLKNIEIKDNYPLSIILSGKSIWNKSDNGIINIERLLDKHSDSCLITAISGTEIMDSLVNKEKVIDILQYFFSACDEGLSPQSLWRTDDCDYESLLLEYDFAENKKQFEAVLDEMTKRFPDLKDPKKLFEDIPEGKTLTDMVSQIEVTYPCTWTVDFIRK